MVIDTVRQTVHLTSDLIRRWADRHLGVGFDQLLLVAPATNPLADFDYRIFNADGGEVEQCGNGARCVARFIYEQGLSDSKDLTLQTVKGVMTTQLLKLDWVKVSLGIPSIKEMPIIIDIDSTRYDLNLIDVGNPHVIIKVDDLNEAEVARVGSFIEKHDTFPEGVNVSFMQIIDSENVKLRVWERGVGLTQACGSAACAAIVFGLYHELLSSKIKVEFPGGLLLVEWHGKDTPIYLTGPAEEVFSALLNI